MSFISSSRLKFGVVGSGEIVQKSILPALQNLKERCEIDFITSSNEVKLNSLNYKFNIKNLYHHDEVFKKTDHQIDALIVASPNETHQKYINWAIENNKHIICESPLCTNSTEANLFAQNANDKNLKFMTAHRHIFHPLMRDSLTVIKNKEIGDIKYVNIILSQKMNDANNFRLLSSDKSGGPGHNLGIKAINIIRQIFNEEPIEVFAFAQKSRCDLLKNVDEAISVVLRFRNQRMAQCFLSYKTHPCSDIEIIGEEGKIRITDFMVPNKINIMTIRDSKRIVTRRYPQFDPTGHLINNFCDSVQKKKDLSSSIDSTIKDLKILDAIHLSIDLGTPISLKEISERIAGKKKIKIPFFARPRFNL